MTVHVFYIAGGGLRSGLWGVAQRSDVKLLHDGLTFNRDLVFKPELLVPASVRLSIAMLITLRRC